MYGLCHMGCIHAYACGQVACWLRCIPSAPFQPFVLTFKTSTQKGECNTLHSCATIFLLLMSPSVPFDCGCQPRSRTGRAQANASLGLLQLDILSVPLLKSIGECVPRTGRLTIKTKSDAPRTNCFGSITGHSKGR